jgi:hypothetical protein
MKSSLLQLISLSYCTSANWLLWICLLKLCKLLEGWFSGLSQLPHIIPLVDEDFCQQYLAGKVLPGFPSFCIKACKNIVLAPTELLLQGRCLWISYHARTFLWFWKGIGDDHYLIYRLQFYSNKDGFHGAWIEMSQFSIYVSKGLLSHFPHSWPCHNCLITSSLFLCLTFITFGDVITIIRIIFLGTFSWHIQR